MKFSGASTLSTRDNGPPKPFFYIGDVSLTCSAAIRDQVTKLSEIAL